MMKHGGWGIVVVAAFGLASMLGLALRGRRQTVGVPVSAMAESWMRGSGWRSRRPPTGGKR